MHDFKKENQKRFSFFIKMFTTKHYYSNMIKFIRTKQNTWDSVDKTQYSDSIVFIEDTQQVCVNNVNYFGKKLAGVERVEFSTSSISIEPNKFYFCNEILNELDITLLGEGIRNYFVEFICNNTCVILPSNIKWKNDIVPDFTKTAIMTIKIQDDTAYLIDCRSFYSVQYPYVTFTAQQDNSSIGLEKLSTKQTLEYSTDTTTWNTFDTTTNISLNNGDKVYVRGILSSDNTTSNYTQFKMNGKIAASGNCNAIWNYQDLNVPLKEYCGLYMFSGCNSLTTAPELPAATLAIRCYSFMFQNCTSLTTVPILPATTLADYCYYHMFEKCTSLTAAPELPATTLTDHCYGYMFMRCSSLTIAPVLPATELATSCYHGMFQNCTSLTTAPVLPATVLAVNCCSYMFYGCTSLTTAPELPATKLADYCCSYMFWNCTSLTTAPVLPATELANYCYHGMFQNCTSLTTAPVLPATVLAGGCYRSMFVGCTSLTTAPVLPVTELAGSCYCDMFQNCTSLTTAPVLPATELAGSCYNGMFQNCTSLTTAPVLPATVLAGGCYQYMFQGCTKLNHITCLATDISANKCTDYWVSKVSPTGTFIKHPNMNNWSTGYEGIPSGWRVENAEL